MKKKSFISVFASVVLLLAYFIGAVASHSSNEQVEKPKEKTAPTIRATKVAEEADTMDLDAIEDVTEFTNQDFEEEVIDEDMNDVYSNTEI